MNPVNPSKLGKVLPQKENDLIFQYAINLDGSFQNPKPIRDVCSIDCNDFPARYMSVQYKKNSERWNIGIHVYKPGDEIYYQVFYWLGDAPDFKNSKLKGGGNYKQCSSPVLLKTNSNSDVATVNASSHYSWLNISAKALDINFSVEWKKTTINTHPANLTPIIGSTVAITNDSSQVLKTSKSISFSKELSETTSIKDTHGVKAGVKVKWEGTVGWFVAQSKFSVEVSLEYSYSHEVSSSKTTKTNYSTNDTANLTVQPHSEIHLSVLVFEDNDAYADLLLQLSLTGTLNGTAMTGDFLAQVVEGIDSAVIISKDADSITYEIHGSIKANVVSHTELVVSDTPPQLGRVTSLKQLKVVEADKESVNSTLESVV